MQYKIPQNVQLEDKILPFMTMKQLIVVGIGGGFAYMLYIGLETQPTEVWLPPVVVITVLTLAVAFLKIGNIPFTKYLLLALERYLNAKRRYWLKSSGDVLLLDHSTPQKKEIEKKKVETQKTAKDIGELSRILDSGGATGPFDPPAKNQN